MCFLPQGGLKMTKRILLAFVISLALSATIAADGTNHEWTDYVGYVGFEAQHYPEDYSRKNPPYGRHVKVQFTYESKVELEISGIRLRVRFVDPFGDVLHETTITETFRLPPGEPRTGSSWYIEDPWPWTGAYNKLAGPAENGTLRAAINVERIAFSDGSVLTFDEMPGSNDVWRFPNEQPSQAGSPKTMTLNTHSEPTTSDEIARLLETIENLNNRIERLESNLQIQAAAIEILQSQLEELFSNHK